MLRWKCLTTQPAIIIYHHMKKTWPPQHTCLWMSSSLSLQFSTSPSDELRGLLQHAALLLHCTPGSCWLLTRVVWWWQGCCCPTEASCKSSASPLPDIELPHSVMELDGCYLRGKGVYQTVAYFWSRRAHVTSTHAHLLITYYYNYNKQIKIN